MSNNYRISSFIQLYPDIFKNRIVLDNIKTRKRYLFNTIKIFQLFEHLKKFQSKEKTLKIIESNLNINKKSSEKVFKELNKNKIIISSKDFDLIEEENSKKWQKYNWAEASNYYTYIKDFEFLNYKDLDSKEIDNGRMMEFSSLAKKPDIYKVYPTAKKIKLNKNYNAFNDSNLWDCLNKKITKTKNKLNLNDLSDILFYTFGEVFKIKNKIQGEILRKAVPSGGARHPTEAYIILLKGKEKGAYHYSVKENALELLQKKISKKTIRELFFGTNFNHEVKAIIILTAIIERSMWRYRESRSYRVIMHDIGHIIENLRITCASKELKVKVGNGFTESKIEKLFKLNKYKEPVLRYITIG